MKNQAKQRKNNWGRVKNGGRGKLRFREIKDEPVQVSWKEVLIQVIFGQKWQMSTCQHFSPLSERMRSDTTCSHTRVSDSYFINNEQSLWTILTQEKAKFGWTVYSASCANSSMKILLQLKWVIKFLFSKQSINNWN